MKSWSGAAVLAGLALLLVVHGAEAQGRQGGQGRGGGQGGTQDVIGGVGTGRANAGPAKPAPRNAAGRAVLGGADMKDKGVWLPVFGILDPIAPYKTVPFQPWAKAVYDMRQ